MTTGQNDGVPAASEAVAASRAASPEHREAPTSVGACLVRLSRDALPRAVVPEECACCGAIASRTLRASRLFETDTLLVPYCAECHAHAEQGTTRRIATGVSALLLAMTLTLGLPLLWQPPFLVVYALVVVSFSLLPLAASRLGNGQRKPGHSAAGRAAWFRFDGALTCASGTWGQRFAAANEGEAVPASGRESVYPVWVWVVIGGLWLLTPYLYAFHFPVVRVLNLTGARFTLLVDGGARADVDATSFENSRAGLALRIPAGRRELVARDSEGRVVAAANVVIRSGSTHLYAPASVATCFWLEATGYGKSRPLTTRREPLVGASRFWVLPQEIDFWFAAAPPGAKDQRSTGGVVRALRQARCDEAPEGVRGETGILAE